MTVATAYWVVRQGEGELRREELPAQPAPGASRVQAECSGVSPGTERLVGLGQVPAAAAARMACRGMRGAFTLPVKYGYCLVGKATAGALRGARVFTMHPHQDLADVADAAALVLPGWLPAPRALLIPNLETAWNGVWDAALQPGEEVAVVGAGLVGLLLAYVLHRVCDRRATLFEVDPARRRFAQQLPFVAAALAPEAGATGAFPVVFHASGRGAGLQTAIDLLGFEGRVIDLSWYGTQAVTLDLGSRFHDQRQRLIASQVGSVAPALRHSHDPAARLQEVLRLLDTDALDPLLGPATPFAALPGLMRGIYAGHNQDLLPRIAYPQGTR